MSALDDMTKAVTALEVAATDVLSEIASLKTAENETALAALTSRVSQVTTNLVAAVPPPPTSPPPPA